MGGKGAIVVSVNEYFHKFGQELNSIGSNMTRVSRQST
jgi:hypothetical protein